MMLGTVLSVLCSMMILTNGINVYVMLPLDTVTNEGQLNGKYPFDQWFAQLKGAGVAGVMADVWWGLTERDPRQYDWRSYDQLIEKVQRAGLKFQATISFHKCGTNTGDECYIPLPSWVTDVGKTNPDIYYTDQYGNRDEEYLSLGVDLQPLFGRRSPIDIYTEYVRNFMIHFHPYLVNTIVELQISLGPAGELRYPSYQLDKWAFPGVGEFQCYDKYMRAMLNASAHQAGHPEWGRRGPSNAGHYNCNPCIDPNCAPFFNNGFDNFASSYGQFFLNWYSQALITHGNNVLRPLANLVQGTGLGLAAKISGIHWQFNTPSHGAELTAGYKNDRGTAYEGIAKMFAANNVAFDFTCFEMKNSEQPDYACSAPQQLVAQTLRTVRTAGGGYDGENALPRYDSTAYETILNNAKGDPSLIHAFTYLRLSDILFNDD